MNNVLIIEDDKEICVMIKDHLEKYNYQVFFTLTGANAIERIKELSPDLIILDLMLPFISGDELIRNIRKFSDVPVIVVSAKSLTFNKVELLRLGADDYLTKPFDLDELLARIERNLLRSQKDTPNLCLTFGELSINTSSKIVTGADEIIVLTAYPLSRFAPYGGYEYAPTDGRLLHRRRSIRTYACGYRRIAWTVYEL